MKHLILIVSMLVAAPALAQQDGDYGSAPGYTGGGPQAYQFAPAYQPRQYTPIPLMKLPIRCGPKYVVANQDPIMECPEGLRPNSRNLVNCECI